MSEVVARLERHRETTAQLLARFAIIGAFIPFLWVDIVSTLWKRSVTTKASIEQPAPSTDEILDGSASKRFETWLQERSWANYHMRGIHNETRLRFGLLESDQVLIRPEGWMFLRSATQPDLEAFRLIAGKRREHLQNLQRTATLLGVTVIAVIGPNKATIYPDKAFGPGGPPPGYEQVMDTLLADLTAAGFATRDLRPLFRESIGRGERVYYYRDTHWNENGARIVARVCSELLQERGLVLPLDDGMSLRWTDERLYWFMPDLVTTLGLRYLVPDRKLHSNPLITALQEQRQGFPIEITTAKGKRRMTMNSREALVAVVGDSFAIPLGPTVALALDTETNAEEATGGTSPAERLYRTLDRIRRGELASRWIVWEFVERWGATKWWGAPIPPWTRELR